MSLFEMHADILSKRQQVVYGHKILLSFGKTGVVLAAQVLRGNPADSTLAVPALTQSKDNTGKTPYDAAMVGGFGFKANVKALKALGGAEGGIRQGRGNRRRGGLQEPENPTEAVPISSWSRRTDLMAEQDSGLGQCRWKGAIGFQAYVWGRGDGSEPANDRESWLSGPGPRSPAVCGDQGHPG